jgi:hypothetical protein
MRLVVHRRLAIPLWVIAVFTVAFTAPQATTVFLTPPTTLFVIAAVGITTILLLVPGVIPSLRTSPSLLRVPSSVRRDKSQGIVIAAAARARTLEPPNGNAADDALDLVRMDDDGGWQMTRPPA